MTDLGSLIQKIQVFTSLKPTADPGDNFELNSVKVCLQFQNRIIFPLKLFQVTIYPITVQHSHYLHSFNSTQNLTAQV